MPLYDDATAVGEAVRCVLDQKTGRPLELVVVDDGSTDDGPERVRRLADGDPRIRFVSKSNGGEASALNFGWPFCKGEHVCLVESDVLLDTGWLETVLSGFSEPDIIAVGGRLVLAPGQRGIARLAGYEAERKFDRKESFPVHLSSAAVAYRRSAFDEMGGFREELVNASLDSDFNARCLEKGYRLRYLPDAVAAHRWKQTWRGYLRRVYAYARYREAVRFRLLYPADREIVAQLILAGLLPPVVAGASGGGPAGLSVAWLWGGAFILSLVSFGRWLAVRGEAGLLALLPGFVLLRSAVALAGLGMGRIRKP
jgi:GT2 family glycosyltransferase